MARKRKQNSSYTELAPGALIFAYLRDSGGSAQEKSVPDQRAALDAYARTHGWVVAGWYADEARSGTDVEHRPAFQELIAECRRKPPPVAGILVWSLSRLGRNELEAQYYTADLRLRGVAIVSATEVIPPEFAAVFESMIRWKDAKYSEDLRNNVRRGQRSNVLKGLAHGGEPPVGYRAEKVELGIKRDGKPRLASRWVIDEEKAPIVRQAFAMRAAGYSVLQIRQATNLLSSNTGYAYMFRNVAYIGTQDYSGEQWPHAFPALIDDETWQRVQELPPQKRYGTDTSYVYLLSSFLRCGHCGSKMDGISRTCGVRDHLWVKQRKYRYRCYVCSSKRLNGWTSCPTKVRDATPIEQAVLARTVDVFLDPANLLRILDEIRAQSESQQHLAELALIQRESSRKRTAIANLLDVAEVEGVATVRERLRERRQELVELEARAALLDRHAAAVEIDEQTVREFCAYHREQLASEDRGTVRRILRGLIERVEVTDDIIDITYKSRVQV